MSDADTPYRQYICRACGLIYDEAEGDPDSGLAPGTRFEDIPDDWECPLCGVTKTDFELFEKRSPTAVAQPTRFQRETGVIVIGAGLAGWSVTEAIRAFDSQVPITLVCACSGDRYHKPELSVALSRGLDKQKLVRETGVEAAKRLGVRLVNHTYAMGISAKLRQLRTTRGTLNYTQLVLAQGSRPRLPPGLSQDTCWRINDLRCWDAMAKALTGGPKHVAIVGAGMIGCELAEDLVNAGHSVTLIHRRTYPLEHLLPPKAGARLLERMMEFGVDFRGETKVKDIHDAADGKRQVRLSDGSAVVCDQVIVATGLLTENRLARLADLSFDRGIVVDPNTLRSSDPNIYALGDCISLDGEPCRFIEPIVHQAEIIAQHVLGLGSESYRHQTPVVRLKTRSLPIVLHGSPRPDLAWHTLSETSEELVMEQRQSDKALAVLRLERSMRGRVA